MTLDSRARFAVAIGAAVGISLYVRARSRRSSFRGRTVFITGGSRGLGLELARRWGAEGARVIICARTGRDIDRAVTMLRQGGASAHGFECDVKSRSQVEQLISTIVKRWGAIDVLVNNAGIMTVGPQACMTLDDYGEMMETHFWAPLYTINAVLPHMRRRRQGKIVNIASIGGEISVPHLLPYSASKFALVGLSEGLNAELASQGIEVTTVCPGLMRTGSPRNATFKGRHRDEYAWFSVGAGLPGLTASSQRAARDIIEACRSGRPYLAISMPAKIAIRAQAWLPNLVSRTMQFVNMCLPKAGASGRIGRRGDDSFSAWSPSALTLLNETAAAKNNEIR